MKEIGILWLMKKGGIQDNLVRAMEAHREKFGSQATVCYANQDDLPGPVEVEGVAARAERSCLRGHLFVGRRMEHRDPLTPKEMGASPPLPYGHDVPWGEENRAHGRAPLQEGGMMG